MSENSARAVKNQALRSRYQRTGSNRVRHALCRDNLLAACCGYVPNHIIEQPDIRRGVNGESVGRKAATAILVALEIQMAKGHRRSNREVKKPKKTAAERAKAAATPVMGVQGKDTFAGQKQR